jgi:hypothetical protein
MGSFLGNGLFNSVLSGCIKTGDMELVLSVFCGPQPPFHRKVRNLHLAPMTIWRCRPWSASIWSGSVVHVQIEENLTYLSTKFKGKTWLLHLSKYDTYIMKNKTR